MKRWADLKEGELQDIVAWFEQPAFTEIVGKLLESDHGDLIDTVLECAVVKEKSLEGAAAAGELKRIKAFIDMHDEAMKTLDAKKMT